MARPRRRNDVYEERITLWVAGDIDEAIALAEEEARTYASGAHDYLGYCQAYSLIESIGVSGVEVFSLLRQSDLSPKGYIDAFFDTGEEHERAV
jgi:hypothetical protein